MSEKIKVPKWFDDWYKSFNGKGYQDKKGVLLHYLTRIGCGYYFYDGGGNRMPQECSEYACDNREALIRAILDGYEIKHEYTRVGPVEAYDCFLNKRSEVFCKKEKGTKEMPVSIDDFSPQHIKALKTEFYTKDGIG